MWVMKRTRDQKCTAASGANIATRLIKVRAAHRFCKQALAHFQVRQASAAEPFPHFWGLSDAFEFWDLSPSFLLVCQELQRIDPGFVHTEPKRRCFALWRLFALSCVWLRFCTTKNLAGRSPFVSVAALLHTHQFAMLLLFCCLPVSVSPVWYPPSVVIQRENSCNVGRRTTGSTLPHTRLKRCSFSKIACAMLRRPTHHLTKPPEAFLRVHFTETFPPFHAFFLKNFPKLPKLHCLWRTAHLSWAPQICIRTSSDLLQKLLWMEISFSWAASANKISSLPMPHLRVKIHPTFPRRKTVSHPNTFPQPAPVCPFSPAPLSHSFDFFVAVLPLLNKFLHCSTATFFNHHLRQSECTSRLYHSIMGHLEVHLKHQAQKPILIFDWFGQMFFTHV